MSLAQRHAEAVSFLPKGRMLIGGEWVQGSTGATMEHCDPSTGLPLPAFATADASDVDAAVRNAAKAFESWRHMPANERRRLLLRIAETIRAHEDELATIMALETGGPVGRPVMGTMADNLEYFAGWADKCAGDLVQVYPRRSLDYVRYEPLGVVAALTPYNVPFLSAVIKLAPALATGNTVVIRPPETGPFGVVRLGELLLDAGLPPGVVNVVLGGPDVGEALVRHPAVSKISFTGGPVVARKILAAAAENLTPAVLELGGKSANIVFEDADLDDPGFAQTVLMVIGTAGQGCVYGTRLLVQESIYSKVVDRVLELAKVGVMGDPLDPRTTIGPVINERAVERILGAVGEGAGGPNARVILGGARAGGELSDGFFVEPTVVVDVDNSSVLAQEEVFGPVLAVTPFSTERQAVELANATRFGLHGYIHTRDLKRAHRVAEDLVVGGVSINAVPPFTPNAPFGGIRGSGYGREGGLAGIMEYVSLKNVNVPLD